MARPPARPFPDDRPLPWRRHLGTVLGSAAVLALLLAFARAPDAVERLYAEGAGAEVGRVLSWASSYVPFSVGEALLGVAAAWVVLTVGPVVVQVARRRRRLRNALAAGLLRLASFGSATAVAFYLVWGLHYARAPAIERFGWEPVDLADPRALEELARLAGELVDLTNAQYRILHGCDDAGAPTDRDVDLDAALDTAYARVAEELGLHPSFAAPRGPAKPLLASALSSWLGIAGIYSPFTGEANYNTLPPAWQHPYTVAHEKAHQRGIASEDEASFLGFLACIRSDDPFVAYSGWLFAQRRLLTELGAADPERAAMLLARRLPGVQRDVDALRAFWASWQGSGHTLGHRVNHAYLTANQVQGGALSYSMAAHLIVAWARQQGGRLVSPDS